MFKTVSVIPTGPNSDIWYNAPQPSTKHVPQWFKAIPQFIKNESKVRVIKEQNQTTNSTLKRCVPFLDAMTTGYTYSLAEDVDVILNDGTLELLSRTGTTIITAHSFEQFDGLYIPDEYYKTVFKFENPWVFNLPLGYSMMFTHPINRLDLPFFTFTGCVDVDSYDIPVLFPFLLRKDFQGIIERGTPVAQFFPIKREPWQIKHQPYDERTRLKSFKQFYSKVDRSYKNQFWHKKSYS